MRTIKGTKDFDMNHVKEILHNTIDSLNDDEAQLLLEYTKHLKEQKDVSRTLAILAEDPTFEVPSKEYKDFPVVKPIKFDGIPASEFLIMER
jgi:hypothetical protein